MSTTPTITLDELILTHTKDVTGTEKEYNVSPIYNKNTNASSPVQKPGNINIDLANTEIKYTISSFDNAKPIQPNTITDYDFKQINSDTDLLDIILLHETLDANGNVDARNHVINHVAINDTKYPPPYNNGTVDLAPSPHDTFTEKFKITELKVERIISSPTVFKVSIKLRNPKTGPFYRVSTKGISIQEDTFNHSNNKPMQAILLHVEVDNKGTASSELLFDNFMVDLGQFYSGGIPIVVAEFKHQTSIFDWPNITKKKGVISIQ